MDDAALGQQVDEGRGDPLGGGEGAERRLRRGEHPVRPLARTGAPGPAQRAVEDHGPLASHAEREGRIGTHSEQPLGRVPDAADAGRREADGLRIAFPIADRSDRGEIVRHPDLAQRVERRAPQPYVRQTYQHGAEPTSSPRPALDRNARGQFPASSSPVAFAASVSVVTPSASRSKTSLYRSSLGVCSATCSASCSSVRPSPASWTSPSFGTVAPVVSTGRYPIGIPAPDRDESLRTLVRSCARCADNEAAGVTPSPQPTPEEESCPF